MTEPVDLLIEPKWIIPIEPQGVVLEDHVIAVRDGRIVAVLPVSEAASRFAARRTVTLPEHVLLPGFVNAHCHAAMSLLRGIADDLPLMRWLQEEIWPAESKHVSDAFVHDGTLLACAEMLQGGITCFADMYFFPEAAARAVREAGMRAMLGMVVIEFPTAYAADAADYIAKGLAARDACRDGKLIEFCMAPHAPYTVSDKSFDRILTLAEQLDVPIQTHLHETKHEIEESVAQHGMRPLARLEKLGLLGPGVMAVHSVHLLQEEIELLSHHGSSVIHCPTSNMKLASGIAPVSALRQAGVRVALGTDGAASNNRLDMLREMRHAALLAKVSTGDATTLNAHEVLRAATLDGADALGMAENIGSLQPGKFADMCAIDLGGWITNPSFDPASHIVYVAGREHISHVWVGGDERVTERKLLQFGNTDLRQISKLWQTSLCA
jgi:5-methylthioadenosine/S-adenosylhomocysteine deaminase